MHDVYPSMYEGAARYFFEGLLPVRQLAYPAHKHCTDTPCPATCLTDGSHRLFWEMTDCSRASDEGTHYTYARYEHEIASAMIWAAVGAKDVFPASQPAVMSDYVYSLLPNV